MEQTVKNIKKSKSIANKYTWFTTQYYILAMLVNFAYLYWNSIRVGVMCAAIMMLVVMNYILGKASKVRITVTKTTLLILVYIIYNLLTIFIGVINGYSALIGISEFSNGLLPIIFYFVALDMSDLEESKFVKSFIYACLFLVLTGMFMYIVKPSIYFEYMQRSIVNYYQQMYLADPRMHSFLGSVGVGSIACMGLAFEMDFFISKSKKYRAILVSLILLIGIILTMQRSAWLFAVMTIILMSMSTFNNKRRSFKFIMRYGLIVIIVAAIVVSVYPNLIERILLRISSMTTAIDGRSANWGYVLKQGIETLVGGGLGTGGHRAMYIKAITIRDGNYFKMIYEIGLIGTIMFIGIMVSTIMKGIRNYRRCSVYLCIVLGILFQAIGSSILTFQLVVPMFWFAIGRINCKVKILKNVNDTGHE